MKKTNQVLKTITDGFFSYLVFYFWTAFFVWCGFNMLGIFPVGFLQVLGGLIIFRQLQTIFYHPSNLHLKPKKEQMIEFADFCKHTIKEGENVKEADYLRFMEIKRLQNEHQTP